MILRMRYVLLGLILVSTAASQAQTSIERTIATNGNTRITFDFEDASVIKIHTWDKSDISIKGSISINKGENDDAFAIDTKGEGGTLSIRSYLKDKEKIPQRIVIKRGDQEYYFRASSQSDPEVQKFMQENGHQFNYMNKGIIKDIALEIWVPVGMTTDIKSTFGLIEVTDFQGPLKATSKFGGVDASIASSRVGALTARTEFGEILSNLDVKFNSTSKGENERWTIVTANPGKGPAYDLESKFGKVYLRKP